MYVAPHTQTQLLHGIRRWHPQHAPHRAGAHRAWDAAHDCVSGAPVEPWLWALPVGGVHAERCVSHKLLYPLYPLYPCLRVRRCLHDWSRYHEPSAPRDVRQQQLWEMYGFWCQCTLCTAAYVDPSDAGATPSPSTQYVPPRLTPNPLTPNHIASTQRNVGTDSRVLAFCLPRALLASCHPSSHPLYPLQVAAARGIQMPV